MRLIAAKYPLVFGALLFIASMLLAAVLMTVAVIVGIAPETANGLSRCAVAILLLAVFFNWIWRGKPFSGARLALPALLVIVWNVLYHLAAGSELVPATMIPRALLLGFAPGILEETVFRGITISNLLEGGKSPRYALWASAILFAVIHLTNGIGMSLPNLLVQVLYSLVIGLFLGMVYLKSHDLATVVLAHAAIDFSNQVFATQPTESTVPMIIGFVVVVAAITTWSLWEARSLSDDPVDL